MFAAGLILAVLCIGHGLSGVTPTFRPSFIYNCFRLVLLRVGGQSTPDTGPDAYRPLKDSATGNTGTGEYASGTTGAGGATGTGAGTGSTGGRGLTGASPSSSSSSDAAYNAASGQSGSVGGTSQGQRGVGSGVGTGKTGTGSGTRDESSISRFSKGYGAEGDRPGYDTTFKGGDPVYALLSTRASCALPFSSRAAPFADPVFY